MSDSSSPRRVFRWIALASSALLLVAVLLAVVRNPKKPDQTAEASHSSPSVPTARGSAASGKVAVGVTNPAPGDAKAFEEFRRWATELATAVPAAPDRKQRVEQGMALARERRTRMLSLIRTNPEQAIAESISFDEWDALPDEIRPFVEKPFSVKADYHYYPVCTPPGTIRPADAPEYIADLEMPDGTKLDAFVYGKRADVLSKKGMAVQGIALDGLAAIRDGVFQEIPAKSLDAANKLFPSGQADSTKSFASGAPVGPEPVAAVAGGRRYVFANRAELEAFDARFAKLEAMPGPNAASSVLGAPLATAGSSGDFDWSAVETFAAEQASAWTETKKNLFLIRINFPDNATDPVSQAAADSVMNGPASNEIRAMSYGKTWVEATTSANVYTVAQPSTYYPNGGSNAFNSELLRDGRNAFRNGKNGADASINIGPVSNNSSGDGGGLGDYNIVGVTFEDIGMTGGTVHYAGLAGGGNLWMQGSNSAGVYTHEWGHCYGLSHASSWDTTDGSVVGAGSSTEYGDIFDIMGGGPVPEGHFHPQGKAKLNWLTSSQWTDATAEGSNTYRIYRIDDANTTSTYSRGIRVTKSASVGNEEYYWVAYRPAYTNNVHLQQGAYLAWQQPGQTRCWLLDTTPGTADGKNDGAIDVGRTYTDSTANVFITPVATGGSGADRYLDVRVNTGPFPGNNAPTSAAISGPATVAARTNASFSISATDADTDTLAYSWDSQDGASNGNTSNLTHAWIAGGTYTLTATVSDMKGGTVTVTKTVTVIDPVDTWTQHTVGTTENLEEVVYAKGRFVAAEYWGTVYESWDGNTWTNVGDPPSFDSQPQLAFGNNVFVMAGKIDNASAAQICYSVDGRTWTAATFPAGVPQVRDVVFGAGKFLAVADGGNVLTSTDGITWTLTTVSGAPDFRLLAWDGSAWVAVAYSAANSRTETVWTSLDGVTWSQHENLGVSTYQVLGAGGVMYALGWYAGVMYSTDHGLTWQDASLPGTTRWSTYRMAISTDGTFFATAKAMDETGTPYALLVSSDGVHWSRTTENGGNTAVGAANDLVFGFGKFLSLEDGGVTRSSNAFYSPNAAPSPAFTANPATGSARQPIGFGATATDADGDLLVYVWDFGSQYPIMDGASVAVTYPFGGSYTATLYVSDGHGGLSTLTHNITVNDPARTFTQRTSGTTNPLNAIAANGTVAVAVGGSGGVIRTSTDGVTWTTSTVSSSTNITFRGATWDGAKFIIVGSDYNFTAPAGWQGTVYTSPDGSTWTRRYGTTNRLDELYAVASDGTGTVAVGSAGTVLVSADGLSWSPATLSNAPANLRGAAWNGTVYAIAGYSSGNGSAKVFTSTNRTDWMDVTSGTGIDPSWQDLRKIAWLNNRFVSSGWYSKLRTSTDNGQTFTTTRTVNERNPAMAYGDGVYFTAGEQLDASNADVDVLSLDGNTWYSFTAPTTTNRNDAVFFKHTFITVGQSGEIWQSGDTTPPTGFATWQTAQFPGGGASSLPQGDPDHDGIPNLIEYALNRNPSANGGSDGAPGSGHAVFDSVRTWLHLDMPEPAMPDVTYVIQGVTELGGTWADLAQKTGTGAWIWTGGGTAHLTEGVLSGGRKPVEVGTPDSASGQPRYFLRLQVTAP